MHFFYDKNTSNNILMKYESMKTYFFKNHTFIFGGETICANKAARIINLLNSNKANTLEFLSCTFESGALDLILSNLIDNHYPKKLILSCVTITDKTNSDLIEVLATNLEKNIKLETLDLSSTKIKIAGALRIMEALRTNDHITELNLHNCEIHDNEGYLVSELEKNLHLKKLNLSHNNFSENGFQKFINYLSNNNSLQTLILNYTAVNHRNLQGENRKKLFEALELNNTLRDLDITDLPIQLEELIDNNGPLQYKINLQNLKIELFELNDENIHHLTELLQKHHFISYIGINQDLESMSSNCLSQLYNCLKHNNTLLTLDSTHYASFSRTSYLYYLQNKSDNKEIILKIVHKIELNKKFFNDTKKLIDNLLNSYAQDSNAINIIKDLDYPGKDEKMSIYEKCQNYLSKFKPFKNNLFDKKAPCKLEHFLKYPNKFLPEEEVLQTKFSQFIVKLKQEYFKIYPAIHGITKSRLLADDLQENWLKKTRHQSNGLSKIQLQRKMLMMMHSRIHQSKLFHFLTCLRT